MRILNLTQHSPTPEQIASGVVHPSPEDHDYIKTLLTFEDLPPVQEIQDRATALAGFAVSLLGKYQCDAVMIGGAPYLMPELEAALWDRYVRYCYSFSRREVVEEPQPDGSVRKTSVFRHVGFIWKEGTDEPA